MITFFAKSTNVSFFSRYQNFQIIGEDAGKLLGVDTGKLSPYPLPGSAPIKSETGTV